MSDMFGIQERMANREFPSGDAAGAAGGGGGGDGISTSSEGATVTNTYYEGSGANRMQVTEFSNGYIKRVGAPEETDDGGTGDTSRIIDDFNRRQNDDRETASSIIAATLKYYGMDEPALLADVKTALADRRITGASTIDDIGIQLRESDAFKRRFAGNEARRAANKPAYSVSQYLQLSPHTVRY
jgi:hypothetical protein